MQAYKIKGWLLLLGLCLNLTGCAGDARMKRDLKNVEERDYATLMMVTGVKENVYHFVLGIAQEKIVGEKSMVEKVSEWDAANLDVLAADYACVKGKDLSFAHLKVVLLGIPEEMDSEMESKKHRQDKEKIGESWFRGKQWQEALLEMFDEEDEIAKTCPILLISNNKKFVTFLEEHQEPVGTYMENLIRTNQQQGIEIPWIKDYLKAMRENESLTNVYLKPVKEGWRLKV